MMHRIGAVMYVIWGVLHLNAALKVYQMGDALDPGMVQGAVPGSQFGIRPEVPAIPQLRGRSTSTVSWGCPLP